MVRMDFLMGGKGRGGNKRMVEGLLLGTAWIMMVVLLLLLSSVMISRASFHDQIVL